MGLPNPLYSSMYLSHGRLLWKREIYRGLTGILSRFHQAIGTSKQWSKCFIAALTSVSPRSVETCVSGSASVVRNNHKSSYITASRDEACSAYCALAKRGFAWEMKRRPNALVSSQSNCAIQNWIVLDGVAIMFTSCVQHGRKGNQCSLESRRQQESNVLDLIDRR